MSIGDFRKIYCKQIRVNKTAQALTVEIQCEPEADLLLCLISLPYVVGCVATFRLVAENPLSIWLLVFILELIIPVLFQARRQTLYSEYEIWTFEGNKLIVSQLKVPTKRLARLLLKRISLKTLLLQVIDVSDIQKVWLQRMCNEGGYYYCFGMTMTSGLFYMYPSSENDAQLLKREIESWLNIA